MNSSGDSGAAKQHVFKNNVSKLPDVNSKRPVTSGEIQDRLRNELNEYSETNPEPPLMKD